MNTEKTDLGGRLPLLSRADLSANSCSFYDDLQHAGLGSSALPFKSVTDGGEFLGPFNALLYAPEIGAAFLNLHDVENRHTSLSKREREVVILSVGSVWQSPYALYAHREVAMRVGLSPVAVDALVAGGASIELSAREQIAQQYTRELMSARQVDPATYAAAERVYGREGVVEMTVLAGIFGMTCGILNAFKVPAP